MLRCARLLALVVMGLGLLGCGSDEPAPDPRPTLSTATSASAESSTADPGSIEGSFDAGGHELFISCHGTGAPTVVYLHGAITQPGMDPQVTGAGFGDLLTNDYRVCLYDRRNVGRSEVVDAVQKPADALRDLDHLLNAAGVEPPYVLVGSSFGGLLAYLYANEHPDKVVGMVLLAAMFPDELSLEHLFAPQDRLRAVMDDQEANSLERLSQYRSLAAAQRYIGHEPAIPVIYLEPKDQGYNDNPYGSPAYRRQIGDVLAAYVDRFSPGVLTEVPAPHLVEAAIPDKVADAVRRVIAETAD
ncbi:MAG: alpha/beta hydrolase [Nocardioides sp.]|nr:alpha/beta hydrolase [Nocardioides sp.]